MGIFGKSDKEKEQEAQQAYQQAQRRLQDAKRKKEQEEARARQAQGQAAPRPGAPPAAGNVPAGQRPAGANVPAAQAPAAPGAATYTVTKGDNLSKIAKKHLGNANRWRELYEANKGVIGDDPDLIKPGQVLRIPGGGGGPQTA